MTTSQHRSARDAEARRDAERRAAGALAAWRERALPDPDAPLDAADVARLVRDCLDAVGIDAEVWESVSVHTVHYYRRRGILDAPVGRTAAARYGVRHIWQAAGARLAGYLGLVTLDEAREAMRGADEAALFAFAAERVADAWARAAARRGASDATPSARGLAAPALAMAVPLPEATLGASASAHARPLPPSGNDAIRAAEPAHRLIAPPIARTQSAAESAALIHLPGGAWCVLPAEHAALRSSEAARRLVRALAEALGAG